MQHLVTLVECLRTDNIGFTSITDAAIDATTASGYRIRADLPQQDRSTMDTMKCRFSRLQKKLGFPMCAYAILHAYTTEGLKKGIDSLTLVQIMGTATPQCSASITPILHGILST